MTVTLSGLNQGLVNPPVTVQGGGTGAATLTGLVKGNGTNPMTAAVPGTDYVASLTAPGPIGGVTPSTGAFTTVTATGGITSSDATGSIIVNPSDVSQGGRVHFRTQQTANTAARNWSVVNSFASYGDLTFRVSTALGGDPIAAGATVMSLTGAGASITGTLGVSGALTAAGALREAKTAMGANNIDLAVGNYFSKTISGAATLTVSNVATANTVSSFILDLTNGGSATVIWWAGIKWAGGTAPTLISAGRDVLGFFTHDGGVTWTGLVLAKDAK